MTTATTESNPAPSMTRIERVQAFLTPQKRHELYLKADAIFAALTPHVDGSYTTDCGCKRPNAEAMRRFLATRVFSDAMSWVK